MFLTNLIYLQIRSRGGLHDHPSALNALYRLRMILLGKNQGIVQSHSNVTIPSEMNEEYLVASALKQAHINVVNVEKPTDEKDVQEDDSASSSSTFSLERGMAEKDGLIYIAGYLAKKHLNEYPELGDYTYKSKEMQNMHSYGLPSWLQSLSFGGLIQPSVEWKSQVEKMEKYFQKFHGNKFKEGKGIVTRTYNYIARKMKNIEIPKELLKSFCNLRVIIRMRYLNNKREEAKLTKSRKRKFAARGDKIAKKMRKIIN